MYYLIGDYVRLGDTTKDPQHSTAVSGNGNLVMSINRCERKLMLHVWQRTRMQSGPDELAPIHSAQLDRLKAEYLAYERNRKTNVA